MLNQLAHKLQKYDKFLKVRQLLDGSIKIFRKSPFSINDFDVLTIQRQYIGSANWIIQRLSLMDTQKRDLCGDVLKNNYSIRHRRDDNRVHREVADFILQDKIAIN